MAALKVTLPGNAAPTSGRQVSFIAPCDCTGITELQIDNEAYAIVDAMSNSISEYTERSNVWCSGALISFLLDVENKRAFLLNAAVKDYVDSAGKARAGFIYPLAGATVPEGFLLCDGAAYSRTEYPELFAAIGTMYGDGDGATTFNVPDLVERVPAGAGRKHVAGEKLGEETHKLTVEEIPSHSHSVKLQADEVASGSTYSRIASSGTFSGAGTLVGSTGGGAAHNNMQPTAFIRAYIIATGQKTGISAMDVISGMQALPLGVEYGGTGAIDAENSRKNLGVAPAVESSVHVGCYYRTVEGRAEWINPPMLYNTEYRTADRHNGKVVYTKAIDIGALPDKSSKMVEHGLNSSATFVSVEAFAQSTTNTVFMPFPMISTDSGATVGKVHCTAAGVYATTYTNMSSYTAYAVLRYTKD